MGDVSKALQNIGNEVKKGVENIGSEIENAKRGDIGKYVDNTINAQVNTVKAIPESAYDLIVRRDQNNASKNLRKGLGGVMYLSTAPMNELAQNNQEIFRDKKLAQLTFGISDDFAGWARGSGTLNRRGYISDEDSNSALRFGSKTAAIVAGGAYLSSVGKVPTPTQAGTLYGAGLSAAKGDVVGAVSSAAGTGYFGELPNIDVPQPINDIIDQIKKQPWPQSARDVTNSFAPTENNPWSFTGQADSGLSAPTSTAVKEFSMIAIGGVFLLVYFLRKNRVI